MTLNQRHTSKVQPNGKGRGQWTEKLYNFETKMKKGTRYLKKNIQRPLKNCAKI